MTEREIPASKFATGLRRKGGSGDAQLVPQARFSGPMPWVIAIMVALTTIAVAAGLALSNVAMKAAAELEGGITVQVIEAGEARRQAETEAVIARLREMPDVVSLRLVPEEELSQLVEPWLGSGVGADKDPAIEIPVPSLIDVRLGVQVTPGRVASIHETLRAVAPSARVDAQSSWLDPVFDAIESLQWLAIALVVLLATALSAAVLLAVRTALGANRETIEIVHLLGGTDAQIARELQRSIGLEAAAGGLLGLLLAGVVMLFLGSRFAQLGAGLVESGALGPVDWVLLALVPVAAAVLAMLTARITVMRTLQKMV
jgi:cell division transport system permease protein